MELSTLLAIQPGITAILGGGGKTTLMYTLARQLRTRGRVILTTTTHIRVPTQFSVLTEPDADRIRSALSVHGAVCVGTPCEQSKLSAPRLPFPILTELADYVLVEADGSRGLPLKAHAEYEPVIPDHADQTLLVIGADGFGRPIREACHRPERYAKLAVASMDDIVTPTLAARVIAAEGWGDRLVVNKAENDFTRAAAFALATLLERPTVIGSLRKGEYECLY